MELQRCALLRAGLWGALLLLLLLQDLALLHLLHYLLRGANRPVGSEARPRGILRLRRLNRGRSWLLRLLGDVFVRVLLRASHSRRRADWATLAGTENDFARGSLTDVSGEQYVVSRTLQ